MIQITVLLVVLALAAVAGLLVRARAGRVRTVSAPKTSDDASVELLSDAGVPADSATVVHFSADWCGPCAAVRRVVGQVVDELAEQQRPPGELELDIDEHPRLAKELGVLSLPTTFVFDGPQRQLFRISGVPSAAALRDALVPLSA